MQIGHRSRTVFCGREGVALGLGASLEQGSGLSSAWSVVRVEFGPGGTSWLAAGRAGPSCCRVAECPSGTLAEQAPPQPHHGCLLCGSGSGQTGWSGSILQGRGMVVLQCSQPWSYVKSTCGKRWQPPIVTEHLQG